MWSEKKLKLHRKSQAPFALLGKFCFQNHNIEKIVWGFLSCFGQFRSKNASETRKIAHMIYQIGAKNIDVQSGFMPQNHLSFPQCFHQNVPKVQIFCLKFLIDKF